MDSVPAGNNASNRFPSLWINREWFVFHALLHFESSNWLLGICRFVDVSWHGLLLRGAGLWFRLRWFLRRFHVGLHPFGVKYAGFINSFVSVRAEEIALGLKEI